MKINTNRLETKNFNLMSKWTYFLSTPNHHPGEK